MPISFIEKYLSDLQKHAGVNDAEVKKDRKKG